MSAPRAGALTRMWRTVVCASILLAAAPATARGQVWMGSRAPRLGSVEVSGGALVSGGFGMGTRNADETRNTNTGTGPFTLFSAAWRVDAAPGAQARLGVYLSRAVVFEAGAQYSRPRLSARLSNDAEQAPDATPTETMTRYLVEGSLVVHLNNLSFAGGNAVPFVSGGGGYIRELHERNELIEQGREYHAGAGLKLWFGKGARRVGVRGDVGLSMRDGGADVGSGRRTVPTAGASLVYLY